MWKSKAMVVLEATDYDMSHIMEHGPYLKQKSKLGHNEGDKRLKSLYVKARVSIGNSLTYHVYRQVQNCEIAQKMTETLSVAFKDTKEKKKEGWIHDVLSESKS